MAARSHTRATHPRARLVRIVAALTLGMMALPAWSATVRDVRVGRHPEFTRVVFELDEQAGYRVKRSKRDLVITVDAASTRWSLGRQGSIESVVMEAGATESIARIRLRQSGLRLQEMILANPPRIVLDLMNPRPVARAETPKPKPAPRPAAKPKPTPAPAPEAKPKPAPLPAAKPEPAPRPEPKPEPEPPAVRPEPAPPVESVARPAPEAESSLESELSRPLPSFVKAAKPEPTEEAEPSGEVPAKPEVAPKPAKPAVAPPARPAPAAALADRIPEPLRNPMILGAAAAGVIVLIALVVVVLRRRRTIPNDLDVTGLEDEPGDGRIPAGGFSMDGASSSDGAADDLFSDFDSAASGSGQSAAAAPSTSSGGSIFDDDDDPMGVVSKRQGDAKMNQKRSDRQAGPTSGPSPSAAGGDIARIVQELQARVGALEGKLEEANDARVRLERQVAAQSEELRVQRAAIARTQRALRSMSRADEDKATEPALKDADTQMKTRVSG